MLGEVLVEIKTVTYQEDNRHVEHESAEAVKEESEETNMVNLCHGALGNLPGQGHSTVHDGANGGKVVEGNKRVHLEVGRAQQALNHGETQSLKDDASNLEEDTNCDEVNLSQGSNDDADNDGRDVEELLQVGSGYTKNPSRYEDSNRRSGLEHLDESNREVEIGQVSAYQTQAEEDTDRDNGTDVDTTSHLDSLSAVKKSCASSHYLGNDGRKGQVVCGEDDGVAWIAHMSAKGRGLSESWHVRKLRVSRSHLLNRMTEELKPIQAL